MLIRKEFFEVSRDWFENRNHKKKNWDWYICMQAWFCNFEVHLQYPYICQHIGIDSKVRPGLSSLDRLGYGSEGPYSFGREIDPARIPERTIS